MGLLESINTSAGRSNNKNYVPAGKHRLRIKETLIKIGTAKNVGKEYFIINGEFVKSSRADQPSCNPGMPASIFVETKMYPEMAADKIKNFLLATATDDDLANFDRSHLPADCHQPGSPYTGQPRGMTWAEYILLVVKHNPLVGMEVDIIAADVDRSAKNKSPVTNYDFQRKGNPPLDIVPVAITAPAPAPVQPQAPAPAAQSAFGATAPAATPAPAHTPAPSGSLFG